MQAGCVMLLDDEATAIGRLDPNLTAWLSGFLEIAFLAIFRKIVGHRRLSWLIQEQMSLVTDLFPHPIKHVLSVNLQERRP
jgi:hypothetical protein